MPTYVIQSTDKVEVTTIVAADSPEEALEQFKQGDGWSYDTDRYLYADGDTAELVEDH